MTTYLNDCFKYLAINLIQVIPKYNFFTDSSKEIQLNSKNG